MFFSENGLLKKKTEQRDHSPKKKEKEKKHKKTHTHKKNPHKTMWIDKIHLSAPYNISLNCSLALFAIISQIFYG